MKFGVVRFPGTCDDVDAVRALERVGEANLLWHRDATVGDVDAVVIPGGFSYGDYLRPGAIARFSPIMKAVTEFAAAGGPVLGICNGFQVLCEAGLLPGALLVNTNLRFGCRQIEIDVVAADTAWTTQSQTGARLSLPAKHMSGRYYVDPMLLEQLEERNQIVFRYVDGIDVNGSTAGIAGVTNEQRNVVGLMPHPEHAVDPLTGSTDGLQILQATVGTEL